MMATPSGFLGRRLVASLLIATPFSAVAQGQTPQAFLDDLYQPYRRKDFKGQAYWEPSRFFAPDLAAAIEKDMSAAKQRKEPPLLDGDPFVDAQEWQIGNLAITTSIANGKAQGAVAFTNLGESKAIALLLVQTPLGWRISDIVSASGSLRKLYKLP
jgi:hypothetical protein